VTWPKVRIQHLASVVSRGSAPHYSESTSDADAWAIGQSCLRPDGSIDLSRVRGHTGPVPEKGRVFGGEVLINSTGTGTLGRVALLPAINDAPTFVDGHITMIRVAPDRCDARFLAYALGPPAFMALAEQALSVGSTKQRELNIDAVRRHVIWAPHAPAQRAVADYLDRECDRIAGLERVASTLVVRLVEPALAKFVGLTDRLSSTQVGYHYEVQLGKMLDENVVVDGELVPYLRNQNVTWDAFDLSDVKTMRLTYADRRRYEIRRGDLLACEGRHVGKSAIWEGEIAPIYYQKALHRIRPLASASNRFLMWCLWLGNTRGDYYADGTGSTIPHLPAEKLRRVRIPNATRDEQDAITRETDAVYRAAANAMDAVSRLRRRLGEYRNAVVSEAVAGQLDVTAVSEAQMDERAHAAAEGAIAVDQAPVEVG
jgi:type I restriction enzyme S subunit